MVRREGNVILRYIIYYIFSILYSIVHPPPGAEEVEVEPSLVTPKPAPKPFSFASCESLPEFAVLRCGSPRRQRRLSPAQRDDSRCQACGAGRGAARRRSARACCGRAPKAQEGSHQLHGCGVGGQAQLGGPGLATSAARGTATPCCSPTCCTTYAADIKAAMRGSSWCGAPGEVAGRACQI